MYLWCINIVTYLITTYYVACANPIHALSCMCGVPTCESIFNRGVPQFNVGGEWGFSEETASQSLFMNGVSLQPIVALHDMLFLVVAKTSQLLFPFQWRASIFKASKQTSHFHGLSGKHSCLNKLNDNLLMYLPSNYSWEGLILRNKIFHKEKSAYR